MPASQLSWLHWAALVCSAYLPHEHRLMMRCQVMADRIFDPAFVRASLQPLAAR